MPFPPMLSFTPMLAFAPSDWASSRSLSSSPLPAACIGRADPLRIAAFARDNALIEELAFHWVACAGERFSEVRARNLVPAASKLKLAKGGEVERIRGEAIAVGNRADLFEPTLGTLVLGDRDGAVQRDNRGRTYRDQLVVERDDSLPVRVVRAEGARVDRRDRSLDVILAECGTCGGKLQKLQSFVHELVIPS